MTAAFNWKGVILLDALRGGTISQTGDGDLDIGDLVATHGAVLVRGSQICSAEDFQAFIRATSMSEMDYTYRSTPRTTVAGKVMTATEYPPQLEISPHCENAYQRSWPRWLAFCCLRPAARGGQTTVADLSRVTRMIGPELVDRFERLAVKYIRHYRPFVDLPWQNVFQTESRTEVARFCESRGIHFEWLDTDTLRTEHVCQGVIYHPTTNERMFFNQAHLFHVSNLGTTAATAMIRTFGPDRLPRAARFGDDSEISEEGLAIIRQAFAAEATDVNWQAGDILVLDNLQVAHGRRAFQGERRVLAALLQ